MEMKFVASGWDQSVIRIIQMSYILSFVATGWDKSTLNNCPPLHGVY